MRSWQTSKRTLPRSCGKVRSDRASDRENTQRVARATKGRNGYERLAAGDCGWILCWTRRSKPSALFYSFGEDRNAFRFGTRSKYFKDWVRANGGPPKRGQEMSPAVLVNPEIGYTVHVGDAVKDSEGAVKDDALGLQPDRQNPYSEAPKRPRGHAGNLASRFTFRPSKPLTLQAVKPVRRDASMLASRFHLPGGAFRQSSTYPGKQVLRSPRNLEAVKLSIRQAPKQISRFVQTQTLPVD